MNKIKKNVYRLVLQPFWIVSIFFSGLKKNISDVLQNSFYNLSKILLKGLFKLLYGLADFVTVTGLAYFLHIL